VGIIYKGKVKANTFFKFLRSSRQSLTLECTENIINYTRGTPK